MHFLGTLSKEVVVAAVRSYGLALAYASPELRAVVGSLEGTKWEGCNTRWI